MMNIRQLPAWATTVLLAVVLGIGCQAGEYYKLGQKAEQKGDSAAAYEQYSRAAARHRTGAVASGLTRTRSAAAAQAERSGLEAMDEDRYDDAWRAFMRTLEIQPDHATAVQLVHQLENEYPEEIASAKHDWITRGASSLFVPETRVLALAPPPPPAPQVMLPPPTNPVRETIATVERSVPKATVAQAPSSTPQPKATLPTKPVRETTPPPEKPVRLVTLAHAPSLQPPASSIPPTTPICETTGPPEKPVREVTVVEAPSPSPPQPKVTLPTKPIRETTAPAEKPVQKVTVTQAPPLRPPPPSILPTIPIRETTTPAEKPVERVTIAHTPRSAPQPRITSPREPVRKETTPPQRPKRKVTLARAPDDTDSKPKSLKKSPRRPKVELPDDLEPVTPPERVTRPEPIAWPEPAAFTSIHTLSLKDRRYRRLGLAVDGIAVKLKDTEDDGAVDLDLMDGKKRIQKVRALELGRSQTFRGKSGTLYRLTLLGIHHKSHTVRLGVKRA